MYADGLCLGCKVQDRGSHTNFVIIPLFYRSTHGAPTLPVGAFGTSLSFSMIGGFQSLLQLEIVPLEVRCGTHHVRF